MTLTGNAVNDFSYCETPTTNCFGVDLKNMIPLSIQPRSGGIRQPRTRVRGLCRPNLASREAMTSIARTCQYDLLTNGPSLKPHDNAEGSRCFSVIASRLSGLCLSNHGLAPVANEFHAFGLVWPGCDSARLALRKSLTALPHEAGNLAHRSRQPKRHRVPGMRSTAKNYQPLTENG